MSRDLSPRSATQKQGTATDLIKPLPAATLLGALRNRQPRLIGSSPNRYPG
jgi:hypothetical protein